MYFVFRYILLERSIKIKNIIYTYMNIYLYQQQQNITSHQPTSPTPLKIASQYCNFHEASHQSFFIFYQTNSWYKIVTWYQPQLEPITHLLLSTHFSILKTALINWPSYLLISYSALVPFWIHYHFVDFYYYFDWSSHQQPARQTHFLQNVSTYTSSQSYPPLSNSLLLNPPTPICTYPHLSYQPINWIIM